MHDTEDLALTFVEEEVGRFDWSANWRTLKESGAALPKIRAWLDVLRIDHDPEAIARCIDQLDAARRGRWR